MNDCTKKRWLCAELPITPYEETWKLQSTLVTARRAGVLGEDVVLLLEHLPVFTLGRRGGLENLAVPEASLEQEGIAVFQVERGGNITFHGPGQLVIYPIIDLQSAGLRVVDYVHRLEEVMIRAAQDWGVVAERNSLNRGVWVGNSKLGSVGIAIRRGICFHGAAFNVNVSLNPFEWMKPCGLQDVTVTSLEQQLSTRVSMSHVRESLKHHFSAVFGVGLAVKSHSELQQLLGQEHFPSACQSREKGLCPSVSAYG
jgi:lipoate-protein ligase B